MIPAPGRLVLLGSPVAHSVSPVFQAAALRALGLPQRYEALDVAPQALASTVRALRRERVAGNVTIPHKEAFAALCDRLQPLAHETGAVNTFWVDDAGALVGDNTDVGGFLHLLDQTVGRRRGEVALLGAGGAAAAVLAALGARPGFTATLWGRTAARRDALARRFPLIVQRTTNGAAAAVAHATLVVNATPVGLYDDAVPITLSAIPRDCAIIDLVCRAGGTAWVRAARAAGRCVADGLPMLVEQGALALERWFGVEAPRAVMLRAAADAL